MADIEHSLGRSVNYVVYDRAEFEAKRSAGDGFLADVLKGPLTVLVGELGGPADLRQSLPRSQGLGHSSGDLAR